jgi:hypothetical protein
MSKHHRPSRPVSVKDRKRGLKITIKREDLPRERGPLIPPCQFHHTRERDVATGRRRHPKHQGKERE